MFTLYTLLLLLDKTQLPVFLLQPPQAEAPLYTNKMHFTSLHYESKVNMIGESGS